MNEYQVFKSGPRKGQPKTLMDRIVRYLAEARSMREVPSKSKKYRTFDSGMNGHLHFVGNNGAVRVGKSPSCSISITDTIHARMKVWEARLQKLVDDINDKLAGGEGAR